REELNQLVYSIIKAHFVVSTLLEVVVNCIDPLECEIYFRVAPFFVCADQNQVFLFLIRCEYFAQLCSSGNMIFTGYKILHAADAIRDSDCRIMVARGKTARKNYMAVKNRAHLIGYRLIHIIAFYQNRVESSN